MRHNLVIFLTILLFLTMLIFPESVFQGASEGLLLWFQIVLPTLLPFIIVSNLLIYTHAIDWLSKMIAPVFCRIFHISEYGSFAVLSGFLCGYPMGSKVTSDLLRSGHISYKEGKYLLSFCNNTSPMFIISYVLIQNLKEERFLIPSILLLMLSPVLMSFLFRKFYGFDGRHDKITRSFSYDGHGRSLKETRTSPSPFSGNLVDTCIMNGFETITKVGGYIMLFSILTELLTLFPFDHPLIHLICIPSLEITNGIRTIAQSSIPQSIRFILCLSLTSFGGWCSVAQTECMIQGTKLPILPYIAEKLVTALATSLFAYLYIVFLY